jgi:hypothetical protein
MSELHWTSREEMMAPEGVEDEALLAAALAAALLVFRRQVGQFGTAEGAQGDSSWRTLGRWEQLRGRV